MDLVKHLINDINNNDNFNKSYEIAIKNDNIEMYLFLINNNTNSDNSEFIDNFFKKLEKIGKIFKF